MMHMHWQVSQKPPLFLDSVKLYRLFLLACMCPRVHVQCKYLSVQCAPKKRLLKVCLNFGRLHHFLHTRVSRVALHKLAFSLPRRCANTRTHAHTQKIAQSCSVLIQYQQCHQPTRQPEISSAVQKQETKGSYSRRISRNVLKGVYSIRSRRKLICAT